MVVNKDVVLNRIEKILNSYEDKDKITHIVMSKRLHTFLGRPEKVCHLSILTDFRLYKLAFFFVTSKDYELPIQAHSIETKPLTQVALKVTRVARSLEDEVDYKTEIAKGTTMNELGFLLANIIREMDENNYCKKEELLKIIYKYLEN